jgi:hypothetical protein
MYMQVQSVKAAWTSDRALIQSMQINQQGQQQQLAMAQQSTTALAVQQVRAKVRSRASVAVQVEKSRATTIYAKLLL